VKKGRPGGGQSWRLVRGESIVQADGRHIDVLLMLSFRWACRCQQVLRKKTPAGIPVSCQARQLEAVVIASHEEMVVSTPTDQPSANIQSRPVPTTPPNLTAEA